MEILKEFIAGAFYAGMAIAVLGIGVALISMFLGVIIGIISYGTNL
jgi:hypothetical protein